MNKIKEILRNVLNTLANCIIPVMPVLIGSGMLKVFLIIFSNGLNIIEKNSGTYQIIEIVANAGYYFLTVFIAISAAEIFKCNKYIAGLLGVMLLSPSFIELVESGANLKIFIFPIAMTSYSNQVITPILIVYLQALIEKACTKILSINFQAIFTPLITLLLMIPLSFCLVGPIGIVLGNILLRIVEPLKIMGPIGNGIYCALLPFIVILGLGGPSLTIIIGAFVNGVDPIIFFSNVLYNSILGVVAFVIYLKKRNSEYLASAITAIIGGASEPSIFGVIMQNIKSLIPLSLSCFVAGLTSGLLKVKSFTIASFGILGIFATIGENSSIINAIISLLVGCIIAFITTYIMFKNETN